MPRRFFELATKIQGLQVVRIIVKICLFAFFILCIPEPAYGFDLDIRDYFRSQVERSDRFIQNVETKVNHSIQTPTTLITKLSQGGFSLFEKRTGVTEDNKLYQVAKNSTLRKTGIKLGVVEGTKDFVMGTVSLLAQLNTLPARTINLAYNVKEKPQEYKEKAVTGITVLAGAVANPKPILRSVQQSWQNTVAEAQKDPLKMGKLQGEVAAFGGTLLIGGGQAKTAAKAGGLLEKVAKVAGTGKATGLSIPGTLNKGLTGFTLQGKRGVSFLFKNEEAIFSPLSIMNRLGAIGNKKSSIGGYPLSWKEFNNRWLNSYSLPEKISTDIKDWAKVTYTPWMDSLSPLEKGAIKRYTASSSHINGYLRGTSANKIYSLESMRLSKTISKALEKSTVPQEIVLFRGTDKRILGDLKDLPGKELVGKVIQDKGFLGTSIFPNRSFIDDLLLVIKVPEGTKGAWIAGLSIFPQEGEFLLNKGQQMKIKKVIPMELLGSFDGFKFNKDSSMLVVDLISGR